MRDDAISKYFYEDDARARKFLNAIAQSAECVYVDLQPVNWNWPTANWPLLDMHLCFIDKSGIFRYVMWYDYSPSGALVERLPLKVDADMLLDSLWANILLNQLFVYKDNVGYIAEKNFMVEEPNGSLTFLKHGQTIEEFIVKFELEMHI